MTSKARIKQLEIAHSAKHGNEKVWVTQCNEKAGLVEYGSSELIGMTRAQVDKYIGAGSPVKTIRVGIDLDEI